MIRTGIPVSVLELEDGEVLVTMLDLLTPRPEGAIDPDDPSTLPVEWQ